MKKSKLMMSMLLLGTMLITSLTGCSGGDGGGASDTTQAEDTTAAEGEDTTTAEAEDTTQAETSNSGDVVNLLLQAEPGTLDASKATDLYSSIVLSNVMVALTKPVFEGGTAEVAKEDGAETIEVSDDGLVWTFKLREGINWSDGKPVTAHDYVYSLNRTLNPETASQYAFLLYPIRGAQDLNQGDPADTAKFDELKSNLGIVAKDDMTLEITLHSPCAYYRESTYFKVYQPMREDFVEPLDTTYGADADKLLYCGPYKITDWKHKDTIALEKNQEYWDADNYPLDNINFRIIEDTETYYAELEAGGIAQCNYIRTPEWDEKFQARDDMSNVKVEEPSVSYLLFNEDERHESVMKNLKLRQAVSAALDREEAVQELYGGIAAFPGYGWVTNAYNLGDLNYRTVTGENPIETLQSQVTDPQATLVEGMQELGLGDDPSALNIKLYMPTTSKQFAELFQAQLQETLGCTIELDLADWAQYQEKVTRYEHDIAGQSWTGDYNDPMTMFDMFLTGTEQSGTGMANAEYDALIQQAGSLPATENEERLKLFAQAEKILLVDECAVAPWAYRIKNAYYYNYLKNYQPSIFGSFNLMGLSAE